MEIRSYVVEQDGDPRSEPFNNLGTERDQQRFDLAPFRITRNRVSENQLKCLAMPTVHGEMISIFAITRNHLLVVVKPVPMLAAPRPFSIFQTTGITAEVVPAGNLQLI